MQVTFKQDYEKLEYGDVILAKVNSDLVRLFMYVGNDEGNKHALIDLHNGIFERTDFNHAVHVINYFKKYYEGFYIFKNQNVEIQLT